MKKIYTSFQLLSFIFIFSTILGNVHAEDECRIMNVQGVKKRICFPKGHKCYDHHGRGDGRPIVTDCFFGGSRGCNYTRDNWPKCNGGRVGQIINNQIPTMVCYIPNNNHFEKVQLWEQFGEIHFIQKDGEEWKDHFDGLNIVNYGEEVLVRDEDNEVVMSVGVNKEGKVLNPYRGTCRQTDYLFIYFCEELQ